MPLTEHQRSNIIAAVQLGILTQREAVKYAVAMSRGNKEEVEKLREEHDCNYKERAE